MSNHSTDDSLSDASSDQTLKNFPMFCEILTLGGHRVLNVIHYAYRTTVDVLGTWLPGSGYSFGPSSDNKEVKVVKFTSGHAIKDEISLVWKIENFLAIKSSNDLINEQQFNFDAGESHDYPTKWCLKLKASTNAVDIWLKLKTAPPNFRAIVDFSFQLIDPNGYGRKPHSYHRQLMTQGFSWGVAKFIPKDNEDLEELIWGDGSIVIKVNFKLYLFKPAESPKGEDLQEEVDCFEKRELLKLTKPMTQVTNMDSRPDVGKIVKVVSKDGVEFYANVVVLAGRSPVFNAMFESGNWMEGQGTALVEGAGGGSLVLEDLSGKTVKVLLNYLTGGVLVKEDWKAGDVILELTYAAHKYQLESLTEFLDRVLPAIPYGTKILAKLTLLTKRLGMKNAEKELFAKLKKTATDIEHLVLDKEGSLLGDN